MFNFKSASEIERKEITKKIAKSMGDNMFATKKELLHLPNVLKDGEMVIGFSSGMMGGNSWLICLTDSRLVFLDKGMLYGLKQSVMSLDKVSSVTCSTGMLFGKIEISLGSDVHKIEQVPKASASKLVNLIENQISNTKNKSSSQTPPSAEIKTQDPYEKLLKLGELKDKGFLTDDEFNIEKRKILAST